MSRVVFAILGILFFLMAGVANAADLDLSINRVYTEGDYMTILVSVKNTGSQSYRAVKLSCKAYKNDSVVAQNDWHVNNVVAGSTRADSAKIRLSGASADKGGCSIMETYQ